MCHFTFEGKIMKDSCAKTVFALAMCCLMLVGAATAQTQSPQQLAWSILQAGATNTNSQQRVSAVTVLALITSDPKALTMAEQALQDQNADVRCCRYLPGYVEG
jgi:predicted component of type VI protein secretion system